MGIIDNPFIVLTGSLIALWLAACAGDLLRKLKLGLGADDREDFNTVRNAALILLALIIGFSFSMAVTRYEQRKNYEAAEANAIGTGYLRADLLPAEESERVRELLAKYIEQRISFYKAHDQRQVDQIDADTAKSQAELWSVVSHVAGSQPTPIVALAVSGMNDVLNSQAYTQAAWWNRIPGAAWWLMGLIAISCNILIGYGERRTHTFVLLILPVILSISFFLIADIDSPRPRTGVIDVSPQNLIAAAQVMRRR
jgi:hypothetical protein